MKLRALWVVGAGEISCGSRVGWVGGLEINAPEGVGGRARKGIVQRVILPFLFWLFCEFIIFYNNIISSSKLTLLSDGVVKIFLEASFYFAPSFNVDPPPLKNLRPLNV